MPELPEAISDEDVSSNHRNKDMTPYEGPYATHTHVGNLLLAICLRLCVFRSDSVTGIGQAQVSFFIQPL